MWPLGWAALALLIRCRAWAMTCKVVTAAQFSAGHLEWVCSANVSETPCCGNSDSIGSSCTRLSFLMYEAKANATLMKHWMTVMSDGMKESGACEQEREKPGAEKVRRAHLRGRLLCGCESSLEWLRAISEHKKKCALCGCNMKSKCLSKESPVQVSGRWRWAGMTSSETWTKEVSSPHNIGLAE